MTRVAPGYGWLSPLAHPSFRRVWTVATLQQFGYWFSSIAFQWLVAGQTGNDSFVLGLLYFCMLAPILLLSLPAGALADSHDRRRVLAASQVAVLVVSGATAALVYLSHPPVWLLVACASAVGAAHAIATPASQALVANSVPAEKLRSAIPLQAMGMNVARIMGPALAGLLILAWGTAESLLTYGAFGLVSLLVLWRLPALPHTRHVDAGMGLMARIGSGIAHARVRPPAALALAAVGVTSLFASAHLAQLPMLAARVSHRPGAFLVLTSAGGLGSLLGVLFVALRRPAGASLTTVGIMLMVLGGTVAGLGWSRVMWLEIVLVAAAGALQFGIMTICNGIIQDVVDDRHRGRVMSLYALCWGGLIPVGSLWLGTVLHVASLGTAFSLNGGIAIAFAAYVLLAPARAVLRPAR